jgi:hypothetical protein
MMNVCPSAPAIWHELLEGKRLSLLAIVTVIRSASLVVFMLVVLIF